MIRILIFSASLFLISLEAKSQFYVKPLQWRPTGELGFLFKNSIAPEIGFKNSFNENYFRSRGGLAYIKQTPRLSAFPINSFEYSFGTYTFFPAVEIIHKYNFAQFHIGIDFTPVPNSKLKPYLGTDISISDVRTEIETKGGMKQSYNSVTNAALSLRGRIGLEYDINDQFSLFFEAQRQYGLIVQAMYYSANDIGLGLNIKIN